MPIAAATFAAATLAMTPPAPADTLAGHLLAGPGLSQHVACGPRFDPKFVRFVPAAPSASGHNPLLRWIAGPSAADDPTRAFAGPDACKQALTRYDAPR
jgi:hypothetical protein